MSLKVKKASVVALFVSLGMKTAASWNDAELKKRVNTLPKVVDEDTDKVKDKKQMDLLKALLKAVNSKEEITFDGEAASSKPAEKAAATSSKKNAKAAEPEEEEEEEEESEDEDEEEEIDEEEEESEDAEEDEDDEDEESEEEEEEEKPAPKKPAPKAEKPKGEKKAAPPKKVGVIQTIIKVLAKGTTESPTTKEDIMKVLVKKFGPGTEANRDEKAMKSTVNSQVPSGLKTEKNIDLKRDGKGGFWLSKEDKAKWAPDAEVATAKKPAKK